ncbi:MAG: HlyD family secretion protein, partial [Acetatifactor sp.]|nr:HlyD family secretion protein [Acetatifactor sp.]
MGNELNGLSSWNNWNNWNKKRGILAGFLLFMGFMLFCTVVAKGIYRNELPRVRLCQVEKRSIHYEINGVGNILPGETYGVYAPQGLRVYTASVRIGEQIQEGDVLFELDMDDLERQIQEETARQNYLRAQINDLANAQSRQNQEQKKLEERLLADYDNLVTQQDLLVNNAELAAESAKLRMKDAKDN